MRCRARWPLAKERSCSRRRRRGSRRRTLATPYLAVTGVRTLAGSSNKIDLPSADPDRAKEQIEQVIGIDASDALLSPQVASASTSYSNVSSRTSRRRGATPRRRQGAAFRFWYDQYRGVACWCASPTAAAPGTRSSSSRRRVYNGGGNRHLTPEAPRSRNSRSRSRLSLRQHQDLIRQDRRHITHPDR